MDGDADLDIVVADRRAVARLQGARWLEHPGVRGGRNKPWRNHFIGVPNVEAMFLWLHDMDGDSDRDLAVPLWLNGITSSEQGDLLDPSRTQAARDGTSGSTPPAGIGTPS